MVALNLYSTSHELFGTSSPNLDVGPSVCPNSEYEMGMAPSVTPSVASSVASSPHAALSSSEWFAPRALALTDRATPCIASKDNLSVVVSDLSSNPETGSSWELQA